jgi:hypothetical protein
MWVLSECLLLACQDCKGVAEIAATPRVRNPSRTGLGMVVRVCDPGLKGLDRVARGRASSRFASEAPPRVRMRELDRALKVHDNN